MKVVRVELQDSIQDFKNCAFMINKETDCFEIFCFEIFDSGNNYNISKHIVAMYPKTSVIGIYYYDKENK